VNQPAGPVGATFAIYSEQEGGTPLWTEDQNVELDASGNYTVMLGVTKNGGVPPELFAVGEARWLQVKFYAPGEVDLSRVLLVSVPYALKAGDADTLGGKPASAYLLAGSSTSAQPEGPSGAAQPAQPEAALSARTAAGVKPAFTSIGTTNYVPKFTDASGDVGNSVMFQNGSNIGVGTTAAGISMDVRPTATSPYAQLGVAQTVDYMTLFASDTFGPAFYWDPTKALRFGTGGTGLYSATQFTEYMRIQPNGYVGIGTQTPAATLDVAGDVNLSGSLQLQGTTVLQFPGGLKAGDISVGPGALSNAGFGYGGNTALGSYALSSNTAGMDNTAVGAATLSNNLAGNDNTAVGNSALYFNSGGSSNTSTGSYALGNNTTGNSNTATGASALPFNTIGGFNVANGAFALFANTSGASNTGFGAYALDNNITGMGNIAIGCQAALNVSSGNSNNIHIGSQGSSTDNGTTRVGTPGTQTSTFIAGIAGVTLPIAGEPLVCIDPPTGQLGTVNCASNGAASAQREVIEQQQRQIQAQGQQIADLSSAYRGWSRLSRASNIFSKFRSVTGIPGGWT
jgi:hypothetical protein